MCGRYVFNPGKPNEFFDRFNVENRDVKLQDNYNVAPGQVMPTITRNSPNKITLMKWGLTPGWMKGKSGPINARSETILEKPMFKRPFLNNRCLIPTSGFYEWKKTKDGKIPYFIHLKNVEMFSFAGIYESHEDAGGKTHFTYAIITTSPNKLMEDIHDRMPVIISKAGEDLWIDNENKDSEPLLSLFKPFKASDMEAYPVSSRVNTPINNSPDLLEREE